MARKSRMSVLKRQREAKKRLRERRKSEKAAIKRERRHGKKSGTAMATREELEGIGIVFPPAGGGKPEVEETVESQLEADPGDDDDPEPELDSA